MRTYKRLTQLTLVIYLSALLVACGSEEGPQPEPYQQKFNTNLPLSIGASISYSDTAVSAIESMQIYNEDFSALAGEEIYEVTFDSNGKPFSFYFSSTPDAIKIHGIDGPLETSSGGITYQLDQMRFNNPLVLLNEFNTNPNGITTATATIQYGSSSGVLNNIAIQYNTVNVDTTYSGSYGALPVTAAFFNAEIQASINLLGQTITIDDTISNTLLFTKGIGIVRHTGTYVSSDHIYNSEIISLNNLPRTIWFNRNNGNPNLASGSSSTFQMQGSGTINPDDYNLVNIEEINSLEWITLQQNSSNFRVTMKSHSNLPTETTSVEVVFEHKVTERRVSAAVILVSE